MPIIRNVCRLFLLGTMLLAGIDVLTHAQERQAARNPCDIDADESRVMPHDEWIDHRSDREGWEHRSARTKGLTPTDDGTVVYDANQGLCWLADGDLAGDPETRAKLNVAGINPNGTMDYSTALDWVDALNDYDGGRGYLGHHNWQLPVTPMNDDTCSSKNNGSFGALCTGSAFGNLYTVGLARTFPDAVVPVFDRIGPFRNVQSALYWTSDQNAGGEVTFSYTTDLQFANTTKYNYFHLLPMVPGPIGTPPAGSGVLRYTTGSAAGKAVYDTNSGFSWTLDANLAASEHFDLTGTMTIASDVDGSKVTVPLIDRDGAMLFDTAHDPGGWLDAMNTTEYAGAHHWRLPSAVDLQQLFQDLNLQPGSVLFETREDAGPFHRFQPFFYWTCQREQDGTRQSSCNPLLHPPPNPGGAAMRWSFDFGDGFQGTDEATKQFYVEAYYPAPHGKSR